MNLRCKVARSISESSIFSCLGLVAISASSSHQHHPPTWHFEALRLEHCQTHTPFNSNRSYFKSNRNSESCSGIPVFTSSLHTRSQLSLNHLKNGTSSFNCYRLVYSFYSYSIFNIFNINTNILLKR